MKPIEYRGEEPRTWETGSERQAYEAGISEGHRRARRHFARAVRRRARLLRETYGACRPEISRIAGEEADNIALAIEATRRAFYVMGYPKKVWRGAKA